MAMTVAERQRKYRASRKQKGLVRKDGWTNREGLLAPPSSTGAWASMTLKELEKELGNLLSGYEDMEKEIVYAEIFEHAKQVEKRFKGIFERTKKEEEKALKWEREKK